MHLEERKDILGKIMQGALSDEEVSCLNEQDVVKKQMFRQWNTITDVTCRELLDSERIWSRIRKEVWEHASAKKILFYKIYGVVASVLLLLSITGTTFYVVSKWDHSPVYIVCSGIQNMQSVSLPDGTEVQLGPGSRLTYPFLFNGNTREVSLTGQAFFDVAKNPFKPFIVHTGSMDVQALGTAFEIFSYDIENEAEAILLHGKVKVSLNNLKTNKKTELVLSPNEKLVFDKQNNIASVLTVDADTYTSWRKHRILSFENEKLSMIIPRLEQWYGRQIICQKDLAEKYRFTFKVRDESLERILYMIGESTPLKYSQMNNGNYILMLK